MNNDFKYIKQLLKQGLVYKNDRKKIFKLYNKYFKQYPQGKITCGGCIKDTLEQLNKYLILINFINN